jgi:hypothetical protein
VGLNVPGWAITARHARCLLHGLRVKRGPSGLPPTKGAPDGPAPPYSTLLPHGEEAITVLFCLVDDAYRLLNPRGRRYEGLKSLSGSEVITECSFPSPTACQSPLAAAAVVDRPQPPVVVYDVRFHARDDVGVVGRGATPPLRHAVNDEREGVLSVSGNGHKEYSGGNGLLAVTVPGRVPARPPRRRWRTRGR